MTVLGAWFTVNLIADGVTNGLVFGMLAMGVVLIYRTTRVINFAVGNLGIIGSGLMALVVVENGWPFWIALAMALVVGTMIGAIIELSVIRRLFSAPRVIVLVATIGVAQLCQGILFAIPDVDSGGGVKFPTAVGTDFTVFTGTPINSLTISGGQLQILVVVPIVATLLALVLNRSMLGKAIAAASSNADAAQLAGISPKLVSTLVWTVAGFLSTLSALLLSADSGNIQGLANLGPNTLVRALAAAVFARMTSFPRAVIAGVCIGVAENLIQFNWITESGLSSFVLFVGIAVVIGLQTRNQRQDDEVFAFAPRITPVPPRLQEMWWVRNLPRVIGAIALVGAIALPFLVTTSSRQFLYATIICYALIGLSLTVLTGWAGQLSLSQLAFAGLSALFAAALVRGVSMDIGLGSSRLAFTLPSVPFVVSILGGALFATLVAMVIGAGALRVRGLMLAVSTIAFGLAAQQYIYRRPFFSDRQTSVRFPRGSLGPVDLAERQRSYYLFCLACLVLTLILVARLRRSGIGRRMLGVRDNPNAAAAYTVSPARSKLLAFALAGFIAGLGGGLLGGATRNIVYAEQYFLNDDSLRLVSIVVIGGIGSIGGPILGALWVQGLPAFFPDNDLVPFFTSSIGLLVLLLYFPGGLTQVGYAGRDSLFRWMESRLPELDSKKSAPASAVSAGTAVTAAPKADAASVDYMDLDEAVPGDVVTTSSSFGSGLGAGAKADKASAAKPATSKTPALAVENVSVHFGGFTAVNDASLVAQPGEVLGLIGTNGAGKSTLINAIGGYVAAEGTVLLNGVDVSSLPPEKRSTMGLGRTFQAATLFPELTVTETVMLALEGRGHTSLLGTALGLPATTKRERQRKSEAGELIDFLGLGRYANRYIAELSTGTRRIVELAGLLALDARVLALDEPTAGVAQKETEAFGPLILEIRDELDATMVVIEHDIALISSISDRLYCLEAGRVIAEGDPDEMRANPLVIASYLGTDTRALKRSDS